ncbi:Coiled-coil domain containing protein 138 [Dissostichus eleginoides]|uniref:Coiled-coil domain containing protein 138 n=1 Tax=Dissostichus eleginoides TaxID=100907 RepID=A0AAD9CL53_DISEL|nr:Coiled-coil domain containing protein 138 [Dissostichus eleginoides]
MNLQFIDTEEQLKQKYLERRKQFPSPEDISLGRSEEAVRQNMLTKRPSKELKSYSKALYELFEAVSNNPDQFGSDRGLHGSNQDLRGVSAGSPLQYSQALFTETDVTLPSSLDESPGAQDNAKDGELRRIHRLSDMRCSSCLVLENVYQEMMTIYEQLKAERLGQQRWERELQERERELQERERELQERERELQERERELQERERELQERERELQERERELQERERRLSQQEEETVRRLVRMEEMLHSNTPAVEEKHQQELSELQDVLRERSKENRRLKASFDSIKGLNDSMRKQLNEIIEENKRLESQSKRVHARLENLQRKYEHGIALKGCQKVSTEMIKPSQKEKTAACGKSNNKGSSSPTSLKLQALLLDWVLDEQTLSSAAGNKEKGLGHCLPPEILLNERCLKVLPLLADQLHHTPSSEPDLLNLLRLILWALRQMDSSTQHVALSATLRRIGEEVSKTPAQLAVLQSIDPERPPCRSWPLYRSPQPHTRILSTLIILRTVKQADVLAQALDSLRTELMSEESRGLFLHSGGVCVLMSMLRAGRGGLHTPVDILMQLAKQSRYLNPFLEACSCEEFFRTAAQLLKNPRLELPTLEKLSVLLQKLSTIRKNRQHGCSGSNGLSMGHTGGVGLMEEIGRTGTITDDIENVLGSVPM